jgi:phosphotransferase system HPr (HPr) family protein
MKIKRLKVDWDKQFPMRAAVQLVRVARRFRSRIVLRFGAEVADARSVLSVIILASSLTSGLGAAVDVEASGDDEQEALQAVTEQLGHKTDLSS